MNKYPWIVIDITQNPNIWKCERCKEEIEQPNHMRLNTAINLMNAFQKTHQKCKDRKNKIIFVKSNEKLVGYPEYKDIEELK